MFSILADPFLSVRTSHVAAEGEAALQALPLSY
jgi:hypothetical protein